eukprot:6373166-Alexandrium_andersonii.AAC.1
MMRDSAIENRQRPLASFDLSLADATRGGAFSPGVPIAAELQVYGRGPPQGLGAVGVVLARTEPRRTRGGVPPKESKWRTLR